MAALTEEDIRYFLADKQVSDNSLELDLEFTSEDIQDAKKRCAAEFNDIPPLILRIGPEQITDDRNFFKYGVAYQLYLSKRLSLQRSDIDFSAGGVTTNLVATRIRHLDKMMPLFREHFMVGANAMKVTHNRHITFGQVG